MRLARSPFPLPIASFHERRSLLAVENLLSAVETVLAVPGTLRRALIVADQQALTVAEMIGAMRRGLNRWPNVFPLPVPLIELWLRAAGQEEIYRRLAGPLVVNCSALMGLNWAPPLSTPIGLSRLMASGRA